MPTLRKALSVSGAVLFEHLRRAFVPETEIHPIPGRQNEAVAWTILLKNATVRRPTGPDTSRQAT